MNASKKSGSKVETKPEPEKEPLHKMERRGIVVEAPSRDLANMQKNGWKRVDN